MPLDHLLNPPDFGAKLRLHGNPGLPVPMLTASCSVGSTAWRGELWVCQQPPELSWWLADWVAGGGPSAKNSCFPGLSLPVCERRGRDCKVPASPRISAAHTLGICLERLEDPVTRRLGTRLRRNQTSVGSKGVKYFVSLLTAS